VMLTGTMVVARDIAHAKIKERIDAGESMPQYMKDHAVYYAGPAKTPEGYASGSFGPTTAGRMDSYVEQFQAAGRQRGDARGREIRQRRRRGADVGCAANAGYRLYVRSARKCAKQGWDAQRILSVYFTATVKQ